MLLVNVQAEFLFSSPHLLRKSWKTPAHCLVFFFFSDGFPKDSLLQRKHCREREEIEEDSRDTGSQREQERRMKQAWMESGRPVDKADRPVCTTCTDVSRSTARSTVVPPGRPTESGCSLLVPADQVGRPSTRVGRLTDRSVSSPFWIRTPFLF